MHHCDDDQVSYSPTNIPKRGGIALPEPPQEMQERMIIDLDFMEARELECIGMAELEELSTSSSLLSERTLAYAEEVGINIPQHRAAPLTLQMLNAFDREAHGTPTPSEVDRMDRRLRGEMENHPDNQGWEEGDAIVDLWPHHGNRSTTTTQAPTDSLGDHSDQWSCAETNLELENRSREEMSMDSIGHFSDESSVETNSVPRELDNMYHHLNMCMQAARAFRSTPEWAQMMVQGDPLWESIQRDAEDRRDQQRLRESHEEVAAQRHQQEVQRTYDANQAALPSVIQRNRENASRIAHRREDVCFMAVHEPSIQEDDDSMSVELAPVEPPAARQPIEPVARHTISPEEQGMDFPHEERRNILCPECGKHQYLLHSDCPYVTRPPHNDTETLAEEEYLEPIPEEWGPQDVLNWQNRQFRLHDDEEPDEQDDRKPSPIPTVTRNPSSGEYDSSDDDAPIGPLGKAAAKMREESQTEARNKKLPNKHSGGCKPCDKPHRKDDEDDPDSDNSGHRGRTIRGNINLSYGQGGDKDSSPIATDQYSEGRICVDIAKHPELIFQLVHHHQRNHIVLMMDS